MRRPFPGQVLLALWLALVWLLLWGAVSPLVVLSAAVAAPVSLAACRLPGVPTSSRPRLRRWPGAVTRLLRDLVTSSAEVAWATLHRGPRTRSAVLRLRLTGASDATITTVASRLSLEPGTLVVDVDRGTDTLYVYVLDVETDDDIARARRNMQRTAADITGALGADVSTEHSTAEDGGVS